jgi:hypothetical protein
MALRPKRFCRSSPTSLWFRANGSHATSEADRRCARQSGVVGLAWCTGTLLWPGRQASWLRGWCSCRGRAKRAKSHDREWLQPVPIGVLVCFFYRCYILFYCLPPCGQPVGRIDRSQAKAALWPTCVNEHSPSGDRCWSRLDAAREFPPCPMPPTRDGSSQRWPRATACPSPL